MLSNGSGDKAKGKGTWHRSPSDPELTSEVKKLRCDMDSLKRKVDKQSEQLTDQAIKTESIVKSMSQLAKDSTATAEAVASSSALVKKFLDVLQAQTEPAQQRPPLPPIPPPPVRPAPAQAPAIPTHEEEDMIDPDATP